MLTLSRYTCIVNKYVHSCGISQCAHLKLFTRCFRDILYKLCSDVDVQAVRVMPVGRYKSGFKRAALKLLGVDTYSCVALHMDVIKPLQGTAAYMQACHHTCTEQPRNLKDQTAQESKHCLNCRACVKTL